MSAIDGMPILRIIPDPNKIKIRTIIHQLCDMGYAVDTAKDVILAIEYIGVHKFHFDYPYGSFKEFKQHTLAGEFDFKDVQRVTKEEEEETERLIKEGKLWVTY